jgi:2-polyprenyl-3-methyl-5-hydroxy-6-metoxy-1,4-benzoquinol methylase
MNLNLIEDKIISIKKELEFLLEEIKKLNSPIFAQSINNEFEELKNLLYSEYWPEAVESYLICDNKSEEDKIERAEYITSNFIEEELKNYSILDFGCGEGHISKLFSDRSKFVFGYDLDVAKINFKADNLKFSNDFKDVIEYGIYDYVFVYDVLDHSTDINDILSKIKSVCDKNSKIIIRCHPWCGRHGCHYYTKINKAFLNLVFTTEELLSLGLDISDVNKIIYPIKTYNEFFINNGFEIVEEVVERQNVEDFFINNNLIKKRIMLNWDRNIAEEFPRHQMEQCFLTYKLKLNEKNN